MNNGKGQGLQMIQYENNNVRCSTLRDGHRGELMQLLVQQPAVEEHKQVLRHGSQHQLF